MFTITSKLAFLYKKFKRAPGQFDIILFFKSSSDIYHTRKTCLQEPGPFLFFEISQERQIFILIASILFQLTPSPIYLQKLKLKLQGFPFEFNQCPQQGHFGQNDQNLHGNYKINNFGANQQGKMAGQASFLGSVKGSPPVLPLEGNPAFVSICYIQYIYLSWSLLQILYVCTK